MIADLIFDLGMNNGDDTDFYLKKGFRVVAVEANPELCAAAEERFGAAIRAGRLHIVNKAIAKECGQIELFVNEQVSGWATTDAVWRRTRTAQGTTTRVVTVMAVNLGAILSKFGVPYYVKTDVQGLELACLDALGDFRARPKFFSMSMGLEVGDSVRQKIDRSMALFAQLGYRSFQIVQQNATEELRCPFPPREGRYVNYSFSHGSSGLFGDELPGSWLDPEQTRWEFRKIMTSYKLAGSSPWRSAWFNKLPSDRARYYLDRLFWRGRGWYDTHARYDGA